MEQTPTVRSLGFGSRVVGMVFSPSETFEDVVRRPSWVGALVLTTVVTAIFVGGFLSTELGERVWYESALQGLRDSGDDVEGAKEGLDAIRPYIGPVAFGQSLFVVPLWSLFVTGLCFLVFTVIYGARVSWRELFAVVVHAGLVTAVLQPFVWTLNYVREEMTSPTTLAAFLPMLDESSFLYRFMSFIDLTLVWWLALLALGLSVLYRRSVKPLGFVTFGIYFLVALAYAAFWGSFSA